jgi:hypothetical protein
MLTEVAWAESARAAREDALHVGRIRISKVAFYRVRISRRVALLFDRTSVSRLFYLLHRLTAIGQLHHVRTASSC